MMGLCCGCCQTDVPPAPVVPTEVMSIRPRPGATTNYAQEDNDGLLPGELNKPGVAVQEVKPNKFVSTTGEPETKSETKSLTPMERDPKWVFSIKFEKEPLGIILTSTDEGTCAYVTEINVSKNEALKNNKLPLKSKLLKLDDRDVEFDQFDDITDSVIEATFPIVLTFCHPKGLNKHECPDHIFKTGHKKQA